MAFDRAIRAARLVEGIQSVTKAIRPQGSFDLRGVPSMSLKSGRPMTTPFSYCVVVLCLLLTACAGGYYTSKINGGKQVYRVDEQGAKTLVYETDQNGHTTIHDAEDPMAKRQVAAQEMGEQIRAKKAARHEPSVLFQNCSHGTRFM
jgi:hypothetical protein